MSPDELLEMFADLDTEDGSFGDQLCTVCARALVVPGAGITLYLAGEHRGSFGRVGPLATTGEDLQFGLGEGPSIDAGRGLVTVAAPDLATDTRWVAFGSEAVRAGIRGAFAAPLRAGASGIGALTAYAASPGSLTAEQKADLQRLADIVTRLVLALQAGATSGALAAELADVASYHPEVHQATGMVSAQLGVGMSEAMVRLRAGAYANGRTLALFASEIVARRVRMEPE